MVEIPYCPVWLRPTFTFKEVFTSKLAHQVGKLHANEKVQWEAIDFDNLEAMLITAKNYIDIFSTDLFWLEDRFAEAHALHVAAKKKTVFARIEDCAPTKELFNRVLAHPFVKNPESGVPWFEVSTYSTQEKENWSASYKLRRKPIYEEVDALLGA